MSNPEGRLSEKELHLLREWDKRLRPGMKVKIREDIPHDMEMYSDIYGNYIYPSRIVMSYGKERCKGEIVTLSHKHEVTGWWWIDENGTFWTPLWFEDEIGINCKTK